MEGLGINLGFVIVQVISFLVMLVILRGWVYRPILNMLARRRETIAQGLEDARVAADARANAEKDVQGIIAQAQQEANKKVREATERSEEVARQIRASAEQEAASIRKAAAAQAEEAKVQALGELRGQVSALALAAAQKVIGESLDEKRQHALIDQFFSGIQGGEVVLLKEESLAGASAEVTSALPLTDQELELLQQEILAKLGESASVHFRVDPAILGGLIIRVGDKVLDGSIAGRFEELRLNLI